MGPRWACVLGLWGALGCAEGGSLESGAAGSGGSGGASTDGVNPGNQGRNDAGEAFSPTDSGGAHDAIAAPRDARAARDAAQPPDGAPAPDAARPLDVGPPPPADAAAPPLPPAAARPPAPPPDASDIPRDLAAERPDLLAGSCVAQGGTHDYLVEVIRRLRARDVRWGFVLRDGQWLGDRAGYFWGDGAAEGSSDLYVVDFIGRHCARPGVDEPAAPGWIDDSAGGGQWTARAPDGELPPPPRDAGPPPVDAAGPGPVMRPLPDESDVVDALAAERPDWLASSCVDQGGNNEFLFELVRRLRARDDRWGLNWKRGNVGDMSQDAIDYFWADGDPEGRTEVYILDIIGGHCGDAPQPAWIDVTEATRQGGTIGRWTLQPLPR